MKELEKYNGVEPKQTSAIKIDSKLSPRKLKNKDT